MRPQVPTPVPTPAPAPVPTLAPTTPTPAPSPTPVQDECKDSTTWYYKKTKNTCDHYVAKKSKNCKKTDEFDVAARDACPVTCEVCEVPAPTALPTSCEDSRTWYYKKTKNTCEHYVAKKTKNCKKKDDSEVKAEDACPMTCEKCEEVPVPAPTAACADSTTWYYKKHGKTCADYVAKKTKNCKKADELGTEASVACPVTCGECGQRWLAGAHFPAGIKES